MTIRKRLARSNIAMLVIPLLTAAVLALLGLGAALLLLAAVALTNLYLTRSLFRHIAQPLDTLTAGEARIRDYTEGLLEGVAQDEATRQRYLQTIYAKEADMETLVNRLFDVFYRGDAARTTPGNGSGIGLAVVKRSAQEMGGTVRAENEAGGGLRVVVTLPLPLIDKCCPYQSTVAKEDRHGENTYH